MLTVRAPVRRCATLIHFAAPVRGPVFDQRAGSGVRAIRRTGRRSQPGLARSGPSHVFVGTNGRSLLMWGLLVCALGLLFGFDTYTQLRNLPVHKSMLEISELIYETCKTYLITQGKFLLMLGMFIAVIISAYFGWLAPSPGKSVAVTLPIILLFSLIGIAGSYGVAWFGIRVNTFANSRTAFASLTGKAFPCYCDSAEGRHEHRHDADQRGAVDDAVHPAVHSGRLRRALLHRIRDRRIAGRGGVARGGRHLHQDRRHRRGSDEDRVQD